MTVKTFIVSKLVRFPLIVSSIWIGCAPQLGAQQAGCNTASYPTASRAISIWEAKNQIRLDAEAKRTVMTDFCVGAQKTLNETGLAKGQIDATAETVVSNYLDEAISGKDAIPPLSYLISRQFTVGAEPGFPAPVRLGIIVFTYERTIERLRVGETYADPPPTRLMAKVGSIEIAGLVGNNAVCKGRVSVKPGIAAEFKC